MSCTLVSVSLLSLVSVLVTFYSWLACLPFRNQTSKSLKSELTLESTVLLEMCCIINDSLFCGKKTNLSDSAM